MENKDLIIQDLKNVIVELNKRNQKLEFDYLVTKCVSLNYSTAFDTLNNEMTPLFKDYTEKHNKLINDLNICQSANKRQSEIIKELQLENSEVNKLLSTYKFSFYLIASIVTVVSVVCSIITLIK